MLIVRLLLLKKTVSQELNGKLLEKCVRYLEHKVDSRPTPVGILLEEDRQYLQSILIKPYFLLSMIKEITVTGFPTCVTDVAMGVLTILFNRQIMKYLNADALAVYGVIVNISTFVQCCAYSVGQASQPIFSFNFGAGQTERIRECLKYAIYSSIAFGLFWTALSLAAPNMYIAIFMSPTPEVLRIAPSIIRAYSLSFLILPLNVFSTYYFQALMKPGISLVISLSRGVIISGILILLLPQALGADSVWYAMLITEVVTAVYSVFYIIKCTVSIND